MFGNKMKQFRPLELIRIMNDKISSYAINNPLEYRSYVDRNVRFLFTGDVSPCFSIYVLSSNNMWLCTLSMWQSENKLVLQMCKRVYYDFIIESVTDKKINSYCSTNCIPPTDTDYSPNLIYYLELTNQILLDIFNIKISIRYEYHNIYNIEFDNINTIDAIRIE